MKFHELVHDMWKVTMHLQYYYSLSLDGLGSNSQVACMIVWRIFYLESVLGSNPKVSSDVKSV